VANAKASDVARLAGVDTSTVSRVLNRSFSQHKYATETVRRVREAARQLGYRPSQAARALRTGKSMLVGMVVSDISNPFFAELAASAERYAREQSYHLIVCNTQEKAKWQAEHICDLVSRGVDGLLISASGSNGLAAATKMGVPIVLIDRPVQKGNWPFVGLDNAKAGQLLGKHLSKLHYKRVGVVMPRVSTDPTLNQRLEGFKRGLGKSDRLSWIVRAPAGAAMRSQARDAVFKRIENSRRLPEAIVGLTNTCTLGSIEAIADLGIAWGESIGLAGIDDFPAASLLRPSVTVVVQPIEQIAAKAVRLLLDYMTKPKRPAGNESVLLDPLFISRDSLPKRI